MRPAAGHARHTRALRIAGTGAFLLLAVALGAGSCHKPAASGSKRRGARAIRLPKDKTYAGDKTVVAVEVPVETRTDLDQPTVSRAEPAAVARFRRKLARAVSLRSRLLLHGDRLVWALPDAAVPGGAAEPLFLVLKAGASVALVVNPKKKQYHAAPLRRLAALLEGTLEPAPPLQRVEILGRSPRPDGTEALTALLVTRSQTGAAEACSNYTAWVRTAAAPEDLARAVPLLWRLLLLPVYPEAAPIPGLDALAQTGRLPTRYAWTPTGQRRALGTALRFVWHFAHGRRLRRGVPGRLFQFPPPSFRQVFGPITLKPGRRLLHRPTRALRPRSPGEPRAGVVHAQNRTRRALFLSADEVLLGWLAPRSEMRWPALPAGYFRFVGHSLLGTVLWGPEDAYVPGPVVAQSAPCARP